MQHHLSFISGWIRNPRAVGAVLPGSATLSRASAGAFSLEPGATVVELGAGTGVVTRALVDRGVRPEDIVAVERDDHFCAMLRETFPRIAVAQDDAFDIRGIVQRRGISRLSAIVSGLPLLWKTPEERLAFLRDCLSVLPPGRPLVQYTYHRASPIIVDDPSIRVRRVARVWMNVPPATVWAYSQTPP
ncbi:MAG: methyltransferase [Pseudomonadota bacterium]|nr:methyltransferase [Pseudomonadota bacterium]